MRSLIQLHALMRSIYLGETETNLREFIAVLEYWRRLHGKGD